jgi:hypothetical protein
MSWSSVARALALALSAPTAVSADRMPVDAARDSVTDELDCFLGRVLDAQGQSEGLAFLQIARGKSPVWVGPFRRHDRGFSGVVAQADDNPMMYRRGDVLTFDRAGIIDWGYISPDGETQGFARHRRGLVGARA